MNFFENRDDDTLMDNTQNASENIFLEDTNGDGVADTVMALVDTDNDGILDGVVGVVDTDGDNIPDATVEALDIDQDGHLDVFQMDLDNDGQPDVAGVFLNDSHSDMGSMGLGSADNSDGSIFDNLAEDMDLGDDGGILI